MNTGIDGGALVAVFVGAPPLPVVVVLTGSGELALNELPAVDGRPVTETEHGLALGEAVTGPPASPEAAVAVESAPSVLESVAEAEAEAVSSVDDAEAEAVESEAEDVGVLEHAGDAESASAETGSTSEVP